MSVSAYETSFVAAIAPEASLRVAARQMAEQDLGLLVVEEDGQLLGVISDRDIALAAVSCKHAADSTSVADVMSEACATIDADAPLHEAVEQMRSHGVRRLPVVEAGDGVQGILAVDDLLRLFAGEIAGLAGIAAEQICPAAARQHEVSAGLRMRGAAEHYLKQVLCVSREASAAHACFEMWEHSVGCALVVDAEGAAVGIVTDRDLVLRVVAAGLDPSATRVATVMSAPLASVEPSTPIEEVIETMRAHAVRRMPVLRDHRPVGIVTYDDLVVCLGQELQALGAALARGQRSEWIGVRMEHARKEAAGKLGELTAQLGRFGDQALDRIGHEIKGLRDRLRRTHS